MKLKIAKYLLLATLCFVAVSFLPWVYMTQGYYLLRYAIMACMGTSFILSFSLRKCLSAKFARLFLITIGITAIEFACFILIGHRFHFSDFTQLIIAFLCISIGMCLNEDMRFWSNVCYYYTIALIIMGLANCLHFAGGFYVPEHYMLNEGKNQVGALIAISAASTFYLGIKLKEQRTHYLVVFILAMLVLILIRARSDVFALLACVAIILFKDANWKWKWNVKTAFTILGIGCISYIAYTGFVGDELKTFMIGGKNADNMEELTSRRWSRNAEGLDYFLHDHITGEEKEDSGILLIHNYILLRLVRYGIWSIPMVGFYLYFGIFVLVKLFKRRKSDIWDLGYVVATVPLIVSFVEPNFPYGPGSVQLLTFILLGTALPQRQQSSAAFQKSSPKKVLHICNDFTYSKVHTELYQKLDEQGVEQIIFTPFRNKDLEGNNRFEGQHTIILYAPILKQIHRLLFHRKIEVITRNITRTIDLSDIRCVHATTLFSDGAVALQLKKQYGLPYIVAIRNTDLNAFLKYAPHLWWLHREILEEADNVVFITPNLKKRLLDHWTVRGLCKNIEAKCVVMPNGINAYWQEHLDLDANRHAHNHSAIYVGNFDNNKNVLSLMNAVLNLKKVIPDIHLDLVGGTGEQEKAVIELANAHSEIFTYHGRIFDKPILQSLYQKNSVFAMVSKHETFGLVYVEAMSQGLTVLYTMNEGIDGLFEEKVGEGVIPTNIKAIEQALQNLFTHPDEYQTLTRTRLQDFNWETIAHKYQQLYFE